jgi:uncharacterized protein
VTQGLDNPDVIDGYKVQRSLGSGDFADVLLVRERETGTQAALKLSRTSIGDSVERLKVESAALQRFNHPNMPRFIAEGIYEGRPYLVMTLALGRSIRALWRENVENNRFFADTDALTIARELLGVLAYLHSFKHDSGDTSGWAHRDIKDANVLADDTLQSVALIDFGFCKEDGASDRRLGDSFFRAGAARYSPPSKLNSPAAARAIHDVFAVGVLLYQLLTNAYPWTVAEGAVGELKDLMQSTRPVGVADANNTVRRAVSDFISNLLETKDEYRPTAAQALDACQTLLEALSSRAAEPRERPLQYERVWRDPIYGDVRLTEYEMAVIDTPAMQRLRHFMQLGLTYVAYDSARHSRLSHAVGCVHRVEEILRSVEQIEGVRIDNDTRLSARLYALIHDVTHIPLGHTIEDEYGFFKRHDENNARIDRYVMDDASQLGKLLARTEYGREVRRHFDATSSTRARSDVAELISGPVGADVLDYVDRDSYFCGLDHKVDSAFLRQLRLVSDRGEFDQHVVSLVRGSYGLRTDREYAVESLYEERYALFLKVYAHKAKIKASALAGKALALALHGGKRPTIRERQIEELSDEGLLLALASGRGSERGRALIEQLKIRQLPVAVYRAGLLRHDELEEDGYNERRGELTGDGPLAIFPIEKRLAVEEALAKKASLKGDQVFIYAALSPPGFKRTQQHRFLIDSSGVTRGPTSPWFTRIKKRHLGLWDIWVFADRRAEPDALLRLGDAAQGHFSWENKVNTSVRQGLLF